MEKKFVVTYVGRCNEFVTQTEAEDYAKRRAFKEPDYTWVVYQAISKAVVPAPAVEMVAVV